MGDHYWSQSGCHGPVYQDRPDVWWYGIPGQGSWYYRPGASYGAGPWFVSGPVYQNFAAGGYECGGAGAPTDYEHLCSSGQISSWQRFEGGRFVVIAGVAHYQTGQFDPPCAASFTAGEVSPEQLAWLDEEVDVPDLPIFLDGKPVNAGRVVVHRARRADIPPRK